MKAIAVAALILVTAVFQADAQGQPAQASTTRQKSFYMVVSAGAKSCLPKARAYVTIVSNGGVAEIMHIHADGLPAKIEFDVFSIQQALAPFGLGWYIGDLETDKNGVADSTFVSRFNKETFILAPGITGAPQIDNSQDAKANSAAQAPIEIFHLGIWFNSASSAAKIRCPSTTTPFNGDHKNAGIQVFNTSSFGKVGPLAYLP